MRKNKVKILICALLAAVMSFVFAGCLALPDAPDDIDEEDIDINLSADYEGDLSILIPASVNEEHYINALKAGFGLKFPGVNITVTTFQFGRYEEILLQLARSGTMPDILWTNTPDYYYLAANGYALDMQPFIDVTEREKPEEFNVSRDLSTKYMDMGKYNGKQYAVPRSMDSVVTFINKKVLSDAGVDMNPATTVVKNGWTWEQFLSVCQKVRTYYDDILSKPNYYPLDNNISWPSVYNALFLSNGVRYFDEQNKPAFDTDEGRAALTMVKALVDGRYISDAESTAGSSFENGTGAMLWQSIAVSFYSERAALQGNMDVVSFPLIGSDPKIGAGFAGYSIFSGTKDHNLAWQFIYYLLSAEGQQKIASGGLNLPSVRKDLADPAAANWGKDLQAFNLAAYTFGENYKIMTDYLKVDIEKKSDIQESFDTLVHNVTFKSKTVQGCIDACLRELDAIF